MNLDQMYNDGKREGRVEGMARGRAKAVLAVLEVRGVPVSAAQRKRVLACTDDAKLDAWVRAAVTTPSADALLSANGRR